MDGLLEMIGLSDISGMDTLTQPGIKGRCVHFNMLTRYYENSHLNSPNLTETVCLQ